MNFFGLALGIATLFIIGLGFGGLFAASFILAICGGRM